MHNLFPLQLRASLHFSTQLDSSGQGLSSRAWGQEAGPICWELRLCFHSHTVLRFSWNTPSLWSLLAGTSNPNQPTWKGDMDLSGNWTSSLAGISWWEWGDSVCWDMLRPPCFAGYGGPVPPPLHLASPWILTKTKQRRRKRHKSQMNFRFKALLLSLLSCPSR